MKKLLFLMAASILVLSACKKEGTSSPAPAPAPPANTATHTPTWTPTGSWTATPTPTATVTLTRTATHSFTPTATATFTLTVTPDPSLPMGIYIAPYSLVRRVVSGTATPEVYGNVYLAVDRYPVFDALVTIGIQSCCSIKLDYVGMANGVASYWADLPTYSIGENYRVTVYAGAAGNTTSDFVVAPGNVAHTGTTQSAWAAEGTGDSVSVWQMLPGLFLTYQSAGADITSPHAVPGSAFPSPGNYVFETLVRNSTSNFPIGAAAAGSGFRVEDMFRTYPVIP